MTVNGVPATGGTATASDTANWSYNAALVPGTNDFIVIATDGSAFANQATQTLSVVHLPRILDANFNGLPDVWENLNGVTDPAADSDGDGISGGDEYRAGTDPHLATSRPEGADGVSYVHLRDHFDDGIYDDRWYLGSLDMHALYGLSETGTELQAMLQMPDADCKALTLRGFSSVDVTAAVYHARLTLVGYGRTQTGLMLGDDPDNRVEVILDAEQPPFVTLRSVVAGIITDLPGTVTTPLQGTTVDVRIAKNGSAYTIYVDTRFDVVQLLLDRDADGLPGTWKTSTPTVSSTRVRPILSILTLMAMAS